MRRAAAALAGLVLGLGAAVAGCTDSPDDEADPQLQPSEAVASGDVMPLSLLVFNVEYGGSNATDQVMADIDADVVGVLESYNRLPEIAAKTGYPYYNVGLQILSKYPILEPSGADGRHAFLEVRPGEAVAMINTHLDYVQDGPNRLERGVPLAEVLATEREVRLSSVETLLPSATRLLGQGWPLLFTGDLNEPSHLDWTAATAAQHGGHGPVPWPVSEALVDAGLRDTYRETHPDPLADPGNTWGQVAGSGGSPRRIDYAYAGGPVEVESAEVVGEQGADGVDRGYPRWTSDHRAVLAQLDVTPVPLPTLIALSSRLVTVGDAVTVTYRLPPGDSSGTVELSGPSTASYDVSGQAGTVEVDTASLAPGAYRVDLVDVDGSVAASNDLYVRPQAARVDLATDAETYGVGDPITVSWTDGPANRWDWIGVYRAEAADPKTDDYLVWGYTGGHDSGALPPTTDGELVLGRDHQGRPWPLPPGRYVVHYLLTDQYVSAGSTSFTVR
ncbi:MAG: endonuclease/exonuclease/phosphatase family protein [Nocardioidaceae bacterium]